MFPMYGGMNSHPYQRGQAPSTQHYYPSWEAVPPQMKEVSGCSSHVQELWPHNFGFPAPMPCQNCCTHGQYPSYYNFRPPYPHFPPQPAYGHCCGGYPAYPQPFSVSCVPPPHYAMEIPRYEYDKAASTEFHCCGCPNHSCHAKGKNNVKIEEQEPEVDTVKNESLEHSTVNNVPYPTNMWIPPGYTFNKEQPRRIVEHESDDQQVTPYVKKHQVHPKHHLLPEVRVQPGSPRTNKPNLSMPTAEPGPNAQYGWFPLDMGRIRQLMEGDTGSETNDQGKKSGVEKKGQGLEKKDQNKQFSYPIIWMPYDAQGEPRVRDQEERTDDRAPAEKPPSTFKAEPAKLEHPDNQAEKGKADAGVENNAGYPAVNGVTERTRKVRTIPVKQLEEVDSNLTSKEGKTKGDVKNAEKTSQEHGKNGCSSQSSSATRKPKLPPICLRVDPPKKKNGNGSSRSPSPPGDKKRLESDHSIAGGNTKELHPHLKETKPENAADNVPKDKKIKVPCVEGREKRETATQKHEAHVEEQVVQEASSDVRTGDDSVRASESLGQGSLESIPQEPSRTVRKVMSVTEAATVIQSAYRGFDVRRSEPLKKLRQIAKVRAEATEVKRQIEALESRTDIDSKEKVVISETIMRLLLNLDAIQGLHSSIRDIRRSAAKELTSLQENLDSVLSRKPAPKVPDIPTVGVQELAEESLEPSRVSSPDEASESSKGAEAQREGEGTQIGEFSQSQPPASQNDVRVPTEKDASESQFNTAPENEPQNEEAISSGECITAHPEDIEQHIEKKEPEEQHLEMKEPELITREMPPGDASDPQESLSNEGHVENIEVQPHTVSSDKGHKEIQLVGLPHEAEEEELIENDISRMDWECDLGTVKVTGEMDEKVTSFTESPQKIIQQLETGVQPHMVYGCRDQEAIQFVGLPQEGVKEQIEDDISRMDWECDLGTVKITDETEKEVTALREVKQENIEQQVENVVLQMDRECDIEPPINIVSSEEANDNAVSGSDVETLEQVEQPSEADVGCEYLHTEQEGHVPVEVCSNEIISGQDFESTYYPEDTEIPVLQQGAQGLQEPVDEVDSLVEPEMQEDQQKEFDSAEGLETIDPASNVSSELPKDHMSNNQAACEFLAGDHGKAEEFQPAPDKIVRSGALKKEVDAVSEMPQADVPPYKDDDEASTLSSDGQASVAASDNSEQIDKRIIEENQKLRDMLEKLLASGKEQQDVISSLTAKVKDMEKKLAKKSTKKLANRSKVLVSRPCGKSPNGSLRQRLMGTAT